MLVEALKLIIAFLLLFFNFKHLKEISDKNILVEEKYKKITFSLIITFGVLLLLDFLF